MKRLMKVLVGLGTGWLVALMVAAPATPALAKGTLVVDDDGLNCRAKVVYPTISAAVSVATPGSTIKVCAGTYEEQVHIVNLPKLKLIAQKNVYLNARSGLSGAIIWVENSPNVKIQGFNISGNNQFSPSAAMIGGIFLDNSSGTIQKNRITAIRENPLGTDPLKGQAILVNNPTGAVKIASNTITDYQAIGIEVGGGIAAPQIAKNTISSDASQNTDPAGIAVDATRGAKITSNVITSNWSMSNNHNVNGIIVFDTSRATVKGNKIYNFYTGILVQALCVKPGNAANSNTVNGNKVYNSNFGIVIDAEVHGNTVCNPEADRNTVKSNKVYAPASLDTNHAGIFVYADPSIDDHHPEATRTTVRSNVVVGYQPYDLAVGGVVHNIDLIVRGNRLAAPPPPFDLPASLWSDVFSKLNP